MIRTGDVLFAATVTDLILMRFGLNERGRIAFGYQLDDGRGGIALATPGNPCTGGWTATEMWT